MMPTSIDHPAPSNQSAPMVQSQQADQDQADGVVHLVLDRRVVRRKLFSRKLRLEGMGTDGPQAHSQGGEKAPRVMKIVGMGLLRWKRFILDIGRALKQRHQFLGVVGHSYRTDGQFPAARNLGGLGIQACRIGSP